MDRKLIIIGLLAVSALFLLPHKKPKSRNRIKALSGFSGWVEDYKDEAVQRMNTGRGFMGLGELPEKHRELIRQLQDKVLSYLDDQQRQSRNYSETQKTLKQNYENRTASEDINIKVKDLRNFIYPSYESELLRFVKGKRLPGYDRIKNELEKTDKGQHKATRYTKTWEGKKQVIPEKAGQMTLFSGLGELIPLYTTWETWYYDTNNCKNKIMTVEERKELGIKGGKSVLGCMVNDGEHKFWMPEEKAMKMTQQKQLNLFSISQKQLNSIMGLGD